MSGPFDTLDRAARATASHVVDMDRNAEAEGFRLNVQSLSHSSPTVDRADLLPLLPPGSQWVQALGWTSLFDMPVRARGQSLWGLGVELVRPRATGGAYPVVRIYLHTEPPLAAMQALADDLDPAPREARPGAPEGRLVLRPLLGRTSDDARTEQACLLREAIAATEVGRAVCFRTAVLAEAELQPLVAVPQRLPAGASQVLVGVPHVLLRAFSVRTQLLLDVRRRFWLPL